MNALEQTSQVFEALSSAARLQIILAIGQGEACVCHLEAVLGMRQAYISQQLMVLRDKELISSRREGKYIFYSLRSPEILKIVFQAARFSGVSPDDLAVSTGILCECPQCAPVIVVEEKFEDR